MGKKKKIILLLSLACGVAFAFTGYLIFSGHRTFSKKTDSSFHVPPLPLEGSPARPGTAIIAWSSLIEEYIDRIERLVQDYLSDCAGDRDSPACRRAVEALFRFVQEMIQARRDLTEREKYYHLKILQKRKEGFPDCLFLDGNKLEGDDVEEAIPENCERILGEISGIYDEAREELGETALLFDEQKARVLRWQDAFQNFTEECWNDSTSDACVQAREEFRKVSGGQIPFPERKGDITVAGRVMDAGRQGIPEAVVKAEGPFFPTPEVPNTVVTDRYGLYRFENLPEGTHTFSAVAPGFTREIMSNIELREGSAVETMDFYLRKGAITLSGEVRGPDGKPISGVRIWCNRFEDGSGGGGSAVAYTGARGGFRFEGMYPGVYGFTASKKEFRPYYREGELFETDTVIRITLGTGGRICGKVEGRFKHSLFEAPMVILFRVPERGSAERSEVAHLQVDMEYEFCFRGLDPGEYFLRATMGSMSSPEEVKIILGDGGIAENIIIRLEEGVLLSGKVTDDRTGDPVEGAIVSLENRPECGRDDCLVLKAVTGNDGGYEIAGIPNGSYAVGVFREGYRFGSTCDDRPGFLCVDIREGSERKRIDLFLSRITIADRLVIEGKVVDERRNGIAGAQILKVFGMRVGSGPFARTDSLGNFLLVVEKPSRDFFLGSLYLGVYHPSFSYGIAKLPPPDEKNTISGVVITLGRGQVFSGRLKDAGGDALELRPLALYRQEYPTMFLSRTQTDANGFFEFSAIPAGTYYLGFTPGKKFADIVIESGSNLERADLVYREADEVSICCDEETLERVYDVKFTVSGEVIDYYRR